MLLCVSSRIRNLQHDNWVHFRHWSDRTQRLPTPARRYRTLALELKAPVQAFEAVDHRPPWTMFREVTCRALRDEIELCCGLTIPESVRRDVFKKASLDL